MSPDDVTFSHPDAWIDMFQGRPNHPPFPKDPVWWNRSGLVPSLANLYDPSAHARVRRQLAPAFTTRALRDQEPILQRYTNLLVERLREMVGTEVDIVPWFNFATFDVFSDLAFGESFDCLQNSRYHPWVCRHLQQHQDDRIYGYSALSPMGRLRPC